MFENRCSALEKQTLVLETDPKKSEYPEQEQHLYPGRKGAFRFNISSSAGDLSMGRGIAVGKYDCWELTLLIPQKYLIIHQVFA